MKSEEAINMMNKVQTETVNEFGQIMLQVAESANTMIKIRITEKGLNASNVKFPDYSTKPMLAGRQSFKTDAAFNQIAGSKEKRKELKWVTLEGSGFSSYLSASSGGKGPNIAGGKHLFEIPGGYKQFRELHGRQTAFVDFSFSGRMWSNIKVVSNDVDHMKGRAKISTTSKEEEDKLSGNTERKGEILALSKEEIDDLSKYMENALVEVWHKNGL